MKELIVVTAQSVSTAAMLSAPHRHFNFLHSVNYWKHNGEVSPGKNYESVKSCFANLRVKKDRHCTYDVKMRRVRSTIVAAQKKINITNSECPFVALIPSMQCACATFSSVYCPALQFFFAHYLTNGKIFEKKCSTQKVYFDFLHNLRLKNFSFEEELNVILLKMSSPLHVKFPVILVRF
jgi:hypothetical protein